MSDSRDIELFCKQCNTKLLDIVVINHKGPRSTFKAVNCPVCGGESFVKEVEGNTAVDSKFPIKSYDSDVDGDIVNNTVRF